MLRAIGRRFQLQRGIRAELYFSGTAILTRGNQQEKFDSDGILQAATNDRKSLFAELGIPNHLPTYITMHGRPIGTIWDEGVEVRPANHLGGKVESCTTCGIETFWLCSTCERPLCPGCLREKLPCKGCDYAPQPKHE